MKGTPDLSSLVYGKVPPQAKDLEEAVLGAIMLEPRTFDLVADYLKPECFYVDAHQRIYSAMMALAQRNSVIDLLTVVEQLRKQDELGLVGGAYAVTKLTNAVASSAGIEDHCKIITEKFIQRELIRISGETIGDAYEDSTDAFDLLDKTETAIAAIRGGQERANYTNPVHTLQKVADRLESLRNSVLDITGVTTGFKRLNQVTSGFQPSNLIILAARPSVGKTAFALNIARSACLNSVGVGFFSLEMSKEELVNRLVSMDSNIFLEKLNNPKLLDDYELELVYKSMGRIGNWNLLLNETPALNILELRRMARKMVTKDGVGLLIVDYLQLMSGTGDKRQNREQEISSISRGLKGLAKELRVPVLALSQMSRNIETRQGGNTEPMLSDLRESGAIEQDADMVMFLFRPDYQKTGAEAEMIIDNRAIAKIAKNRHGPLASIPLEKDLRVQRFFDGGYQSEMNAAPAGFTALPQFDEVGGELY